MAANKAIDRRTKILITILALGLAAGFAVSPWARGLDSFVYDTLFAIRGRLPAPERVVVVAIDEPTFATLGLQWPWPRSVHAELIDRLFRDGAAAVALDIVFAEPSDPEEDAVLTSVLEAWSNTVLAVDINVIDDDKYVQQTIVGPWPELLGPQTVLGYVNLPLDPDGFVRRADYSLEGLDALSLAAASLAGASGAKALKTMAGPGGLMGINYYGPPRSITTVSYYQALLEDHLPEGYFRDKVVFVGLATSSDPHGDTRPADHFATPFMRWKGGYMAGVEIHAQAAATLLAAAPVGTAPVEPVFLVGLILGLIAAWVFFRLKPLTGGLILVGLVAGLSGLTWYLFNSRHLYLPVIFLSVPVTTTYLGSPFIHYWQTWREKTFIRKAFSTYLAPSVVAQLIEDPDLLTLGGRKEELTVLFSDIRGFTTISEALPPEVLSQALNSYLDRMTAVTFKYEGVVDKFIGDAVMAIFGAPVPQKDHAARACATALEMLEELDGLNPGLQEMGSPPFEIGIGLNTGPMVVGNLGSSQRFDYTVIGDNVNLGSRLEGQTKDYGVRIIVSQSTRDAAESGYLFRTLDLIAVKGKSEPVAIHQLIGPRTHDTPPAFVALMDRAFDLYLERRFAEAAETLVAVAADRPGDKPAALLLERCRRLAADPPPDDWDGVEIKTSK